MEQNFGNNQIKGSIDELIIRTVMNNNGKATWGQLKKCRPKPLADPVLKKAIDRLKKERILVPKPGFIKDKGETLYCLHDPIPMRDDKELSWWVNIFIDCIESDRKFYENDPNRMTAEIKSKQCFSLSILTNMLTDSILYELTKYSEKTNDTEAAEYLDTAIHKYIAVIIKEIARVVSPRYGSAFDPIEVLQIHLFKYMTFSDEEILEIQQERQALVNKL